VGEDRLARKPQTQWRPVRLADEGDQGVSARFWVGCTGSEVNGPNWSTEAHVSFYSFLFILYFLFSISKFNLNSNLNSNLCQIYSRLYCEIKITHFRNIIIYIIYIFISFSFSPFSSNLLLINVLFLFILLLF
jgi:hypothetical protein